jgi:hypothetical protein
MAQGKRIESAEGAGRPPGGLSAWAANLSPRQAQAFEFLLVTALAFLFTYDLHLRTITLFVWHPDFVQPWDHQKYLYMMAGNPFDFHIAPYCWRVGVPVLAKILPFGDYPNFLFLSFVGLVGSAVALYFLLRACALPVVYAVFGLVMLFTLEWASKFALHDIWLPDPLALALLTVCVTLAVRGRALPFAVVLAAGVLVKESVLFAVPLWYTFQATKALDRRSAWKTALLALPAVVILVLLRLAIPQRNADAAYLASLPDLVTGSAPVEGAYTLGNLFHQFGLHRMQEFSWSAFKSYTVDPFKLHFLALAVWGAARHRGLFVRVLPFLALVYAQLLFASDNQRLLVAAAPVVLLLAVMGCRELVRTLEGTLARGR